MRKLDVFFDYSCPYCLRGHELLLELLPQYPDIEVVWHGVEAHPRPEDWPPHTDLCMQGLLFVQEQGGDEMAYHERLYDALHKDDVDVENAAALAAYVADLVDEAAFLHALTTGKYTKEQAAGNDYAYDECGVWYLPAFRMEGAKLDSEGDFGVTKQQLANFLREEQ